MRGTEHGIPPQRPEMVAMPNGAVQIGCAGGKQRAAEAGQHREKKNLPLYFHFHEVGPVVSGTAWPTTGGDSTPCCQEAQPKNAVRPLRTVPKSLTNVWLLVVTVACSSGKLIIQTAREGPSQTGPGSPLMWPANSALAAFRCQAVLPGCCRSDKNQRRKRSLMACFMTSPLTSEMERVRGISFGQTSTQFWA
jgi:hypothetical protein